MLPTQPDVVDLTGQRHLIVDPDGIVVDSTTGYLDALGLADSYTHRTRRLHTVERPQLELRAVPC